MKHPHPASSETHFASPAHPTPGPATTSVSTCLTNGSDHPSPPVFHQARKWTSNSAVLGAKVADPAFQSVSTEIHIPSSVSSPKILSPETLSGLPAASLSSPIIASQFSLTSAQKRRMRKKRPITEDQSPVQAPAPEQSRVHSVTDEVLVPCRCRLWLA